MLVLDRPIPIQDHRATAADYQQKAIDHRGPRKDELPTGTLRLCCVRGPQGTREAGTGGAGAAWYGYVAPSRA